MQQPFSPPRLQKQLARLVARDLLRRSPAGRRLVPAVPLITYIRLPSVSVAHLRFPSEEFLA